MSEDLPHGTITQIYRDRSVTFDRLVATDESMQRVIEQAKRAAQSDAAVLILGESGTGKNLVAQAIHNASHRAEKPFVAASCAAFAETVIESELFGHERGAFTGADRLKKGVFELAEGGTLFLDEVGELSKQSQAKLLRAVEYKEFERVGGEKTLKADLRILFATNRDIDEAVRSGEFREDLYWRVNEFRVELPPLRRRRKDIPQLSDQFLAECRAALGTRATGFTDAAQRALVEFDWPGNVRRLRAVVRRACAIADGELIDTGDLDLTALAPRVAPRAETAAEALADWNLATMERRHIETVLAHTHGNKSEAARILGIARTTLDRKVASYGIEGKPE